MKTSLKPFIFMRYSTRENSSRQEVIQFLQHIILVFTCTFYLTISQKVNADIIEGKNLLGIPPDKYSLYENSASGKFNCLDGSGTINIESINDDYCDCRDASDEPGTSACPHGRFFCQNIGYKPESIPAGWVNDGRCDCCDGSDEYSSKAVCQNSCFTLGELWRNEQEKLMAVEQQGSIIRNQYKEIAVEKRSNATRLLEQLRRELSEKEQSIKLIEDDLSADFGPDSVFYPLKGECFKLNVVEYTYSLCPFDKAVQESRDGLHLELGRWGSWVNSETSTYQIQKYENGVQCWNGPARSTVVQIKCGVDSRLISVNEPSRCEYSFEFESPAACPNLTPPEPEQETKTNEPIEPEVENVDGEEHIVNDETTGHDEL